MSTLVTYATANSHDIESAGTSVYATAQAGGGSLTVTGATYSQPGQWLASTVYHIIESCVEFDTSIIHAGDTISAATLAFVVPGWGDESATDFTIQARLDDYGASVTTADWIATGSLSGKTLLCHKSTTGIATGSYVDMVDDALAANIVKGGYTRMVITSDRVVSGTTPGGLEDIYLYCQDATYGLRLTVTYTTGAVSARSDGGDMSITVPASGDPITAAWGEDVADQLNAGFPLVLAADEAFTSSSFADLTGFAIAAVTGHTYRWAFTFFYTVGGTNTGLSISHVGNGGATGTVRQMVTIYGNGAATGTTTEFLTTSDTATGTVTTDSTQIRMARLEGYFACTGSGTLQFRRQRNGTNTTVTILKGSGGIVTVT